MATQFSPMDPSHRRQRLAWFIAASSVSVLSLLAFSAWQLQKNAVAQMLLGVIVSLLTTCASVYATQWYAKEQRKDELTRYGLLAFRNLEALAAKMTASIGLAPPDEATLRAWLLDVDLGRWAWRDLLREVFKLQERLQADADELAHQSLMRLAAAGRPEERNTIEAEQRAKLAELAVRAPLPLLVPVQVQCPMCDHPVQATLSQRPGESAHPVCAYCGTAFPIHRLPDDSVKVGDLSRRAPVEVICPGCSHHEFRLIPQSRSVEFVYECPSCNTHVLVQGTATDFTVADLKRFNTNFNCPACKDISEVWISPTRRVSFIANCTRCDSPIQIEGTLPEFSAVMVGLRRASVDRMPQ